MQQLRTELRYGSAAELPHHAVRFRRQNPHRAVNPRLSGRDESIECRTAYSNCMRPQGERFHDVGAAPEAAVNDDCHAAADRSCNFGKHLDRGDTGIKLPAAMITQKDAIAAEVRGALRV